MQTKTYIAVTIGPITKTLQSVKSTKGIWAASYMFSAVIRQIIESLKKNGHSFLVPFVMDDSFFDTNKKMGVGLFPDRFMYVQNSEGDFDDLQVIIATVLNKFILSITGDLQGKNLVKSNEQNYNSDVVTQFIRNYIKVYSVRQELTEDKNPIEALNQLLDSAELQDRYMPTESSAVLNDLFEHVFYNFLIKEGFQENKFPSTIEIASGQLSKKDAQRYADATKILRDAEDRAYPRPKNPTDEQELFIEKLRDSFPGQIHPHHKYIAVVQADGDNMGAFIEQLFLNSNDENGLPAKLEVDKRFAVFSKQLMKFSLSAVDLVKAYGGYPVYAGGDDLLYFAPLISVGDLNLTKSRQFGDNTSFDFNQILDNEEPKVKSILWLAKKLDKLFYNLIINHPALIKAVERCPIDKKPSLSFGISLSYYKFPLNEAMSEGINLLFEKAKSGRKNSVAYSVLKHSGQTFGAIYNKSAGNGAIEQFNQMLNNLPDAPSSFLSSVMFKLESQKMVLCHAAQRDDTIKAFFINNFNEKGHLGVNGGYLSSVEKLIREVFKENPPSNLNQQPLYSVEALDSIIHKIYASLRYIQFVIAK